MRAVFLFFVILGLRLCLVAADAGPLIWTRTDGQTIHASLVRYDSSSGTLTLRQSDGQLQLLSVDLLIEEHRQRVPPKAPRPAGSPRKPPEGRAPQPGQVGKPSAETPSGRWGSFVPERGGGHSVHVYLPRGYVEGDPKQRSTPVLFLFSPGGNSREVMAVALRAADELGWVVVGIDAYWNATSPDEGDEERLIRTRAAIEATRARVAFDPKKMVFGGMSGGGLWAFQCTSSIVPDAVGVISCGGWLGKRYDQAYARQMAVAIINGDQDEAARFWERRDAAFLKSKASATMQTFRFAGGHVLPPPETFAEAARWVHQQQGF